MRRVRDKREAMNSDAVFVGMDLGSFKTSICCSNGRRASLRSAVGRPKDYIAKGLIGGDVAFGDAIELHPLALDVVRPFGNRVVEFNDPQTLASESGDPRAFQVAAKTLVSYAVSQVTGTGVPVFGVVGTPSRTTLANKQVIIEAAKAALDAVVVVPGPFAVGYGMDRLTNTLVLDIGAGTIDLCPMYGAYPADGDQITIPIGGDYIDHHFAKLLRDTYPAARISQRMVRLIKEKHGCVHGNCSRAVVLLPVDGVPKEFDVTDLLHDACRAIVPPILDGIKLLVARFDCEVQLALRQNIVIAGGGGQLNGLDRQIEKSLVEYGGGSVSRAYDSVFAGASGALKLAMEMPFECWERLMNEDDPVESSKAA